MVRHLIKDRGIFKYQNHFVFNWEDTKGEPLGRGEYILNITAKPTYSSKKFFKKVINKRVKLKPDFTFDQE